MFSLPQALGLSATPRECFLSLFLRSPSCLFFLPPPSVTFPHTFKLSVEINVTVFVLSHLKPDVTHPTGSQEKTLRKSPKVTYSPVWLSSIGSTSHVLMSVLQNQCDYCLQIVCGILLGNKNHFFLVRRLWRFWMGSVTWNRNSPPTNPIKPSAGWWRWWRPSIPLTCLTMHREFFQFGWGVCVTLSIIKLEYRLWFIYLSFGYKVGLDHNNVWNWVKHQHISVINNCITINVEYQVPFLLHVLITHLKKTLQCIANNKHFFLIDRLINCFRKFVYVLSKPNLSIKNSLEA